MYLFLLILPDSFNLVYEPVAFILWCSFLLVSSSSSFIIIIIIIFFCFFFWSYWLTGRKTPRYFLLLLLLLLLLLIVTVMLLQIRLFQSSLLNLNPLTVVCTTKLNRIGWGRVGWGESGVTGFSKAWQTRSPRLSCSDCLGDLQQKHPAIPRQRADKRIVTLFCPPAGFGVRSGPAGFSSEENCPADHESIEMLQQMQCSVHTLRASLSGMS